MLERCTAAVQEETLAWVKGSTVIARALVHCPAAVPPLFDAAAAAGLRFVPRGATHAATPPAASGAALLQALLGAWAERFDAIAQAAERKLCAMAFLAALALPLPQPAACFEVLMAHVTAVQAELRERGLDGAADFSDGDAFAVLQAARCDDGGGACDDPVLVASEDADGALRAPLPHGPAAAAPCARAQLARCGCRRERSALRGVEARPRAQREARGVGAGAHARGACHARRRPRRRRIYAAPCRVYRAAGDAGVRGRNSAARAPPGGRRLAVSGLERKRVEQWVVGIAGRGDR